MESKVTLYDANDIKIGQTFQRRARQLVKQQRAHWISESRDAIRFAPGMEHLSDTLHDEDETPEAIDAALMKVAKRRVYAKFGFRLHCTIVVSIMVVLVFIYLLTDRGGYFWPIWPALGLSMSIIIHWVVYKFANGSDFEDQIAQEYERLKDSYR
ncbi:MAG: 2TM domain-containing protein [Defluviitaleaceae bacterium]|nr:2TM domain-containing protein [Defluviitaleaceae bacterium]MCL2275534.1 2TM domain-containing protein [Defluviitaleaceae bacterium]